MAEVIGAPARRNEPETTHHIMWCNRRQLNTYIPNGKFCFTYPFQPVVIREFNWFVGFLWFFFLNYCSIRLRCDIRRTARRVRP